MIRAGVTTIVALMLVLARATPVHAQREAFLNGVRALADSAAAPAPARVRAVRDAADRMRAALASWDRAIAGQESPARAETATSVDAFRTRVQLGLALRARGRAADALRQFDAALLLQPSSSDLQVLRALTLDAMGRDNEAVAAFREAWALDPGSPAKTYYVARRASGAERARAQAALIGMYGHLGSGPAQPFPVLDSIPDDLVSAPLVADAATDRAFALLREGKFGDAVEALTHGATAAAEGDNSPAAHLQRGRGAEAEGRVTVARREYESALNGAVAGRAVLYVGIARLAQVDGDPAAAVDAFTRAARLRPNDPNIHKELALALEALGQTDDALCEVIAALLIDPNDVQAHALVGQLDLDAGRNADAVTALMRALALSPRRYETHYTLATAFTRVGRISDATHELELFERGRADALAERRRQISSDVDREEAVRRGLRPGEAK